MFYPVETLSRLHDGFRKAFSANGLNLLLLQHEGEVFIIENRCPHMDVSLSHAVLLDGKKIQCRAHGIEFELQSGKACGPLAATLDCLRKFRVAYDGNKVGIDI